MEKSKVYFTNLRTKPGHGLLDKLQKLILEAGIKNIDFKDKFIAVKIHFGEPGNLAYKTKLCSCSCKTSKGTRW